MNYKLILSILFLSFIVSCSNFNQVEHAVSGDRGNDYYENRKNNDKDREIVLSSSKNRRGGNICEGESKDHECRNMCKDMYRRIGDKRDCEELTVTQVAKIYELWEILEEPDEDDLTDIELEDFDVYLNISIASLEDLIDRKWSSREAKDFLLWLINDEDIAKIFEKEDDEFDTLTELLRQIKSFDYDDIWKPFVAKIDSRERLMEVVIDSGSEDVMVWFMNFIEDKSSDCRNDNVSRNCFEVFCRIGDGIDEDFMEDWLDYDQFESYIEDIIDDKINANNSDHRIYENRGDGISGWTYGDGNNQFEDIDDISEDWVEDLCGGLLY